MKQIAITASGLTMRFGSLVAVDERGPGNREGIHLWISWAKRFRKVDHNKNVVRTAYAKFGFGDCYGNGY